MKGVVVVLSGGQDSATCLSIIKSSDAWQPIHTISFDYGQRHRIELECAEKLSFLAGAIHHVVPINSFSSLIKSNLLNQDTDINAEHPNDRSLPSSFVPGRNIVFITFAAALAYTLGIRDIFTGVCQTDYSGYPDCRYSTIRSLQETLQKGLSAPDMTIHTPLMNLSKAEIIACMEMTGNLDWYAYTHTCYNGKRPPCGECPACKLRAKGFAEYGIVDPLLSIGR